MTAKKKFLAALVLIMGLAGCTTYERQVVPFKMPENMTNAVKLEGAAIAVKSFTDAADAQEAFGFAIMEAGILPLQVVLDNKSEHSLMIVPQQTFLIDEAGNVWPILEQDMAYERLARHTELGGVAAGGAKKAVLMGTAGAIIGAAVGIVSGRNIGAALGKGAAIGAAAGAVIGGAEGSDTRDVRAKIRDDLRSRTLHNRAVQPQELAYGFLFFPGEVKKAKILRLQLKIIDTG
ncbi:MAG TPA: hypothetical protein PKZ12_07110, partial [Smithellaceae bacterium]|nr:hypothetical protein [Smithellaceae bacterium]